MRHRPLLLVVSAFAAGIFFDNLFLPSLFLLSGVAFGVLVVCWVLAFLPSIARTYMFFCMFLSLLTGMVYHQVRFHSFPKAHVGRLVDEKGTLMQLRGVVIEPSFARGMVTSKLPWIEPKVDTIMSQFILKVSAIKGRSRWYKTGGIVRVRVYDPEPLVLKYGQEVEFFGRVYTTPGPKNPGQLDYKSYLQGDVPSIRALASLERRQNVKLLDDRQGNLFFHFLYVLKGNLEEGLKKSAFPGSAAIMTGVVWGTKEEIPRGVLEDFIKTGTYHFLAISGTQVGMIVVTLHFFLFLLRIPHKHIAPLIMGITLLYAIITGFEPPVLRAAFLTFFCYGALLARRGWDLPSGVSAAVLAILLFNPSDLFNPGFQLSLSGFLGLVYLSHYIELFFWRSSLLVESLQSPEERPKYWFFWIAVRKALCVSLGAWVATSPLVFYYFHLFSTLGAILSLVLFPLFWVITIGGFALSILGQFSTKMALPLAYVTEGANDCVIGIVSWISSVPFTCIFSPSPSWYWILTFYVLGVLALLVRVFNVRWSYTVAALLVMGNAYIYSEIPISERNSLKVSVLDVGHGSCVFVEFPNRRTMIYDAGGGGSFDVGRNIIAPFLWQEGVKKLDFLVISHEDADHYNAVPFLTERFSIGKVLVSSHLSFSEEGRLLLKFFESKGISVKTIQEGVEVNGLGGASLKVLNPPKDNKWLSANDASSVVRVDYKGHSLLLCGDIIEEWAIERLLIASTATITSDVVVAPHHGSYTPNLGKFLDRVSPEYIVVSTNRKSLDYYPGGDKVLSTFEEGAVNLTLGDGDIKINCYLPKSVKG